MKNTTYNGVNDFINESFNPAEKEPMPRIERVVNDNNPEIFYS